MRRPRSLATAAALIVAAVFGTASAGHHGAHVVVAPGQLAPRVGPSYLYPEPALTPGVTNPAIVGAKTKDKLETALKVAVCNGTLTLSEAQHIIATDWFQYYRDHVLK